MAAYKAEPNEELEKRPFNIAPERAPKKFNDDGRAVKIDVDISRPHRIALTCDSPALANSTDRIPSGGFLAISSRTARAVFKRFAITEDNAAMSSLSTSAGTAEDALGRRGISA